MSKIARADDFAGRPIPALGIGTARTHADVMLAVRQFAPEMTVTCRTYPAELGQTEGQTIACHFDEIYASLIGISFDAQGRLILAYIDNSRIVD